MLQMGYSARAHYLWGGTGPASILHAPGCYLGLRVQGQDWDMVAEKPEVFPTHLCFGLLKSVLSTGKCFMASLFIIITVSLTTSSALLSFFFLTDVPIDWGR